MNAKKIMGAVLVALLAAALFIGAGAAADLNDDGKTVFVNQKLDAANFSGNWVGPNGAYTPVYDPGSKDFVYFEAGKEGVYTAKVGDDEVTITVKAPTASISGIAGTGASTYSFIPGTLYTDDKTTAKFIIDAAITPFDVYLAKPNEAAKLIGTNSDYEANLKNAIVSAGTYSVILQFPLDNFVNGTTPSEVQTQPLTFNVAKADIEATISASVTETLKDQPFTLTIIGQPGVNYTLAFDKGAFDIDETQLSLSLLDVKENNANGKFQFNMSNEGKIEILVKAGSNAGKSEVIKLVKTNGDKPQGEVTIKIITGAITDVKTDAASYFIGAPAKVTGLTSAGDITEVKITGNNFEAVFNVTQGEGNYTNWEFKYGSGAQKTFEFTIPTGELINKKIGATEGKLIDVGPYVVTLNATGTKASVALLLTQPFLSIVSGPEVVVQGEEAEFIINAEAVKNDKIKFYIFGNNYFKSDNADPAGDGVDTHFLVSLNETETEDMDEGQYFAVFQHPYLDGEFNVTASNDQKWIEVNGKDVIDLTKRQSANAAEALCVELDAQNIDDIYVKHSFFVVDEAESSYISDIPEEVAKGTTITVNGVDTANAGKPVTVQMLSTAFAAIPKEEQNLASFAVIVNTVIAEDGTWEVALDTSDLAIDEYNVKVFIDGDEKKKAVTNVVAAGDEPVTPPTDEPVTPPTDEPVAPETPGFGALAALAGLGAVAVLLLRRE
ncbi:MAG: PGF-CTERM sorting domain-containing protein [Methanocorpusculum parvum]|nr:PGF-CTERM sorting domain-containing protein [Methanocorpusculum parvum]